MRYSNELTVVIVMLFIFGVLESVNKVHNFSDSEKIAVEQKIAKKNVLIDYVWPDGKRHVIREGDVHTANFQINLVHGGYVGTGPATEIIRTTDSFSYPSKHMTGNSGLITNAGINEYHMQFDSIFGEKYDCHIFTRRMLDRAIIRDKKGRSQLYLAEVEWQNDKTLSVTLNPTSDYELKELDKVLFRPKAL
jgi:hypothetical protein